MGNTNRVTRLSNFNVSSKHRNVTGNDAALIEFCFKIYTKIEQRKLIFFPLTLNLYQYQLTKLEAYRDRMQMDFVV
jgi:hypothetical protein